MEKIGQAFSLPILSELRLSMRGQECQKALEHDGVPSEVLKTVFRYKLDLLLSDFNGCMKASV